MDEFEGGYDDKIFTITQDGITPLDTVNPDIAGEVSTHVRNRLQLPLECAIQVEFDIEDRFRVTVLELPEIPSNNVVAELTSEVRKVAQLEEDAQIVLKLAKQTT